MNILARLMHSLRTPIQNSMIETLSKFVNKSEAKEKESSLDPESQYKLDITNEKLTVTHPFRETESIRWKDITRIVIVSTDDGPTECDLWIILIGEGHGCSIPFGSNAWDDIYEIVSKFEEFNFEALKQAATFKGNKLFTLWKKS